MNKIALPTSDGFKMVAVKDIVRCEADSNYTKIILVNGASMMVCRQFKVVEQALPDAYFVRVHHSHLVNLEYVDYFIRNGGGKLYLTNGDEVEVSRNRKKDLMEKINMI